METQSRILLLVLTAAPCALLAAPLPHARAWLFREIERGRSARTWISEAVLKGISRDLAQE